MNAVCPANGDSDAGQLVIHALRFNETEEPHDLFDCAATAGAQDPSSLSAPPLGEFDGTLPVWLPCRIGTGLAQSAREHIRTNRFTRPRHHNPAEPCWTAARAMTRPDPPDLGLLAIGDHHDPCR